MSELNEKTDNFVIVTHINFKSSQVYVQYLV